LQVESAKLGSLDNFRELVFDLQGLFWEDSQLLCL
jgi:hypothetical protein